MRRLLALETVCPACRTPLKLAGQGVTCSGCAREYGRNEYWDLAPGLEYSDVESAAVEQEEAGERFRAASFYRPRLQRLAEVAGTQLTDLRVLDDGCGFGAAVEQVRADGIDAYGIDVGWRSRDWKRRDPPWPYLRADGRALPFADGTFDAVVSFGVIEHVGIEGETGASEEVASDYQAQRARYVSEALRVLRRPGIAILAQPNGSCPVDFWHYAGSAPLRFHRPTQPFLPRYDEIRSWALAAAPDAHVEAASPDGLLAFGRIRSWWYGRLFAGGMEAWFRLLRRPRVRWLAASGANPFLTVIIVLPDQ